VLAYFGMHGANRWQHGAGSLAFGIASALITIRTGGIALATGLSFADGLFNAVVVIDSDGMFHGSPGIFAQAVSGVAWFDLAVSCALLFAIWFWVVRRYPASEPTADVFASTSAPR